MPATAADKKREREWQAEDDHRTVTRVEEIRSDKTRMAGVRRHQRKSERALRRTGRALGRRA